MFNPRSGYQLTTSANDSSMSPMRALLVLLVACGGSESGKLLPPDAAADAAKGTDACASPVRLYPDVDGDSFGDATSAGVLACGTMAGHVMDNSDCADQDANAKPGQAAYFGVPITGPTQHNLPFDYNCDGVEMQERTSTVVCQTRVSCGGAVNAWAGQNVPACGVTGSWVDACAIANNGTGPFCSPVNAVDRAQACL